MVHCYKHHVFGHYPSSCLFLKKLSCLFFKKNCTVRSIYWTHLSRFYLRTGTQSSLRNVVLKNKQDIFLKIDKTMDNVQKPNTCSNIPLSQTFRSYFHKQINKQITRLVTHQALFFRSLTWQHTKYRRKKAKLSLCLIKWAPRMAEWSFLNLDNKWPRPL
jgi:hypothetical protein